jgi:hypothetical protein
VFVVRYELGFYIPEDDISHSHRREYLKSYKENCHLRVNLFPGDWKGRGRVEMYGIGSVGRKTPEALRMTAGDVP